MMAEKNAEESVFITVRGNQSSLQNQIIAVFICTLGTFSLGCAFGWLSPVLDDLRSEKVLDDPMSESDIAWAGGFLCIGALIGQPIFNIVSKNQGRKVSAYVAGLPIAISFVIKIFAESSIWILVSQCLTGIGGAGSFALPSLYISETVEPRARGTLSSLLVAQYSFGIFVAYVLGALFSYETFTAIMLAPPLIFMLAFWFMPETPLFRLKKGEEEGAARAVAWLRKLPLNSVEVRTELVTLARQLRGAEALDSSFIPTKDDLTREMQWIFLRNMKCQTVLKKGRLVDHAFQKKLSPLEAIFSSRAAIHGLVLCVTMILSQTFMGLAVITIFSNYIFESVHIKLSSDLCSIIYSIILIIGSVMAFMMMDSVGRRFLQISSCFIVFFCELILAVFFQLSTEDYAPDWLSWTALLALAVSVISFNMGAGNVPFVGLAEYFSAEVRDVANNIIMTLSWTLGFVLVQYFTPSVKHFGTANVFYFFAICSLANGVFSYYFVPETKGKTQNEILMDLETKIFFHR